MKRIGAVKLGLVLSVFALPAQQAMAAEPQEAKIADLQRQVDELKEMVRQLQASQARTAQAPVPVGGTPGNALATPMLATGTATAPAAAAAAPALASAHGSAPKKAWYEKLQLRGYTQLRANEIVSGPKTAPAGVSRLRSVQDSGINDTGNFSIRRARLVVQGDISSRVSIYIQGDLAAAVSNQSGSEPRQNFFQMRDAYADIYLDKGRTFKLRLGQSKVPFGWENLQSSSNRVPLDRTDAINAPVPGERDIGVLAFYTPPAIQAIWDELAKDGQKLFGNYGAIGIGVYNGQGINRAERTEGLMSVAMITAPFRLDGLGGIFRGQVAEIGVSGILNRVRPEVRTGGVSTLAYTDNHVGVHAMLYPRPFGLQAEWTWGKGPQWDRAITSIQSRRTQGGYVMAMYRLADTPIGQIIPFGRWQHYRGGWKAATNAPRLRTDEFELGIEWLPMKEIEVTLGYANIRRNEADERRTGRAKGDVLRTQVQFNY